VKQALVRGASCDEQPSGEILTPDGSHVKFRYPLDE
jgi:hypothetical protein